MVEIPWTDDYDTNVERTNAHGRGFAPCIVCGRAVNVNSRHWEVRVHHGGSHIVSEAEAERLNAEGHESSDLGCYPIGPDCLKKNPDIKPFAVRTKGY